MSQDFDHIAESYDRSFTNTKIGKMQRDRVWKFLTPYLNKNQEVLELNCGTGYDAKQLAEQSKKVLATDISSGMVEFAQSKASPDNLQFQVLDANDVGKFEQPFDLVFSNFGGLNCLSPDNWKSFVANLHSVLTSNGVFVAVIMGRNCVWERKYFNRKKEPEKAIRRQSEEAVFANVEGVDVPTWYYSPEELINFAKEHFELLEVRPIGLFIPPSYLEPFFVKRKLALGGLHLAERITGAPQRWADKADHYFISFKKKVQ